MIFMSHMSVLRRGRGLRGERRAGRHGAGLVPALQRAAAGRLRPHGRCVRGFVRWCVVGEKRGVADCCWLFNYRWGGRRPREQQQRLRQWHGHRGLGGGAAGRAGAGVVAGAALEVRWMLGVGGWLLAWGLGSHVCILYHLSLCRPEYRFRSPSPVLTAKFHDHDPHLILG